ncbi:MAG TPA: pyridoxamine 5'-phosphate oxidase family protein [Clostridia bacterium]|nr:pyridoxamine 5'-phosphate oxidase family protein [Clostridia bacterium]
MMKYHMRKSEREIKGKDEITNILKNGKYAVISMCRNNEPYIVTLSYGYDESRNSLYFHSAKAGLKIDFIKENPKVCATVIIDGGYLNGECEHKYASVVFWGDMYVVDKLEEKKHALVTMIDQLEEMPEPVKARLLKNDGVYEGVGILRLDISEITGKKGS